MEDRVISFLSRVGKIGTLTFGIVSFANALWYLALARQGSVSVDDVFREKNRYVNKIVSITGEAQGERFSVADI